MTSTRLPGKVLMELQGKPVLQNIIERAERAKEIEEVVVATSMDESDDEIERFLHLIQVSCFRGSLENVLERFYLCACQHEAEVIVRLTGDNALVAPEIIDKAIKLFLTQGIDYLYYKSSLPLGMCIEVIRKSALEKAFMEADDPECLEHVTPYIRNNPNMFKTVLYEDKYDIDRSNLRFTMDTPEDYEFVSTIYHYFQGNDFSYEDILAAIEVHPEWVDLNKNIVQKKISYLGEDSLSGN